MISNSAYHNQQFRLPKDFAKKTNLFAPEIKLTSTKLNDFPLGTYLMLEHTTDAIIKESEDTEFILRRRYGSFYDVKYWSVYYFQGCIYAVVDAN